MTHIENEQIKELSQEVKELNGIVQEQDKKITRVVTILAGDELDEDGGLIKRIKVIENRLLGNDSTISNFRSKLEGMVFVFGALAAILAAVYYGKEIFLK